MGIAVDDGRGSLAPQRLQHVFVVDVELGDRGEVGAQPVAVVVEPVLQQRGAVVALRGRLRHPCRELLAPGGILELEV